MKTASHTMRPVYAISLQAERRRPRTFTVTSHPAATLVR
jgi:hypothetical protein